MLKIYFFSISQIISPGGGGDLYIYIKYFKGLFHTVGISKKLIRWSRLATYSIRVPDFRINLKCQKLTVAITIFAQ